MAIQVWRAPDRALCDAVSLFPLRWKECISCHTTSHMEFLLFSSIRTDCCFALLVSGLANPSQCGHGFLPVNECLGIGLAMLCAQRGYKCVLVMAEPFSVERRKLMRFLGAKLAARVNTPNKTTGLHMVLHFTLLPLVFATCTALRRVILTPKSGKGTGMVEKARELAEKHGWLLCHQFLGTLWGRLGTNLMCIITVRTNYLTLR